MKKLELARFLTLAVCLGIVLMALPQQAHAKQSIRHGVTNNKNVDPNRSTIHM